MTYSTCRIDRLTPVEIPALSHIKFCRQKLACDLAPPERSGHYWLPQLREWATVNGKQIHYRDNCWIEVELSADELRDFLRDTYGQNSPTDQTPLASLKSTDRYLLTAEEF